MTGCGCHDVVVFGHSRDCQPRRGIDLPESDHYEQVAFDTYLERRLAEERGRDGRVYPSECAIAKYREWLSKYQRG